jgi:hypothetical protein
MAAKVSPKAVLGDIFGNAAIEPLRTATSNHHPTKKLSPAAITMTLPTAENIGGVTQLRRRPKIVFNAHPVAAKEACGLRTVWRVGERPFVGLRTAPLWVHFAPTEWG